MSTADEHRQFLVKTQFFVPSGSAGRLSEPERLLLARYGHWLEALANGVLSPDTPAQKRFVRAARGEVHPVSDFEAAGSDFGLQRRASPRGAGLSRRTSRTGAVMVKKDSAAAAMLNQGLGRSRPRLSLPEVESPAGRGCRTAC